MLIIAREKNARIIADNIISRDRDRFVISGIAIEDAQLSGSVIGNYSVVKALWGDIVFLVPTIARIEYSVCKI